MRNRKLPHIKLLWEAFFLLLKNETTGTIISQNLKIADNYFSRLKGLMFTKELPDQDALQIIPCGQIHTFFMKYSLDVLYLDTDKNILSVDEELKPGKVGRHVKKAASVVELPAGKIKEKNIKAGEKIEFIKL